MLIISAGMPKSGSGYMYNLINDLEISAGNADAREIKKRCHLEEIMQQHNNNIGLFHFNKLIRLWKASLKEGDFTVKTHSHPTLGVRILSTMGLIKIIYCYRDPRDVLLSAMDHGKKSLHQGIRDNFIQMTEFDNALPHVKGWVDIWKQYHAMPGVLLVKYEEIMNEPLVTLSNVLSFLGISLDKSTIQEILWKYSKENKNGDKTGLHLNKAVTARYKDEMTNEQKTRFSELFANELTLMGYPVNQ